MLCDARVYRSVPQGQPFHINLPQTSEIKNIPAAQDLLLNPPSDRRDSNDSRKRKFDDLRDKISRLESLYTVQIGTFIDETEFKVKADTSKTFREWDLALVKRTGGGYQYVIILFQQGEHVCYHDSLGSYQKKTQNFFGVVKPEEVLAPTQPIDDLESSGLSASMPEALNCEEGPRTLESEPFIDDLSCAHPTPQKLVIGGANYYPVSSKTQGFSTKRLASCGSIPSREILLLDPRESPLLDKHFQEVRQEILELQERIGRPLTPDQVLSIVKRQVKTRIFFAQTNHQLRKVEKIIREALTDPSAIKVSHSRFPGEQIPALSVETFISQGAGLCRHTSLTICYLLDRLSQTLDPTRRPILEGTVQHMRDNILLGAHSWSVFVPKSKPHEPPQRWLVDAQFDLLENFALPESRAKLGIYGDGLYRMIERTNNTAASNGQPPLVCEYPPTLCLDDESEDRVQ